MFKDSLTKIEIVNCDDTGSKVSDRFDYQLACAFLTFLTLPESNEDFAVILERVDDFLIVENLNQANECVSFVQVKTQKSGPYTINCVIKNEWIKKQANNYLNFLDISVKNIFLSNFGVKIDKRIIDDTSLIKINDLPEGKDKNKIIAQIEEVLNGFGTINDFYLLRGTLSLDGYQEQLKGHLVNYVNKTVGGLNSETIETIYKTIWNDLHTKQSTLLNEEEKKDYQTIVDKKGIEYSKIKEIVGIAKSIEIPDKKDISIFHASNHIYLGDKHTVVSFLSEYQKFRSSSYSATKLLEECRKIVDKNNDELIKSASAYDYSKNLIDLFDKNEIISCSSFYKEYKLSISAMFTYKMFQE